MDFPKYFADAEATMKEAAFVLFGVPFEKTSSFRHGADKAPREIRQASWNFESFDLKNSINFQDVNIHDYGDLDVKDLNSTQVFETTRRFTSTLLADQKRLIALGGDHSITPGIVSAFPKDTAVLSLDAHMDFRNQYKNDKYNHACVIRRIADHLPLENIAVVGIRSAEQEEYEQAQKQGLLFLDVFSMKQKGMKNVLQQIRQHFKRKSVFLTLDIDVVDPAYAPGTSTPEPFGLTPFDVLEMIEAMAPQLVGCDVVEVCPPYDHGQTALLAAKLMRSCISSIWKNQKRVT